MNMSGNPAIKVVTVNDIPKIPVIPAPGASMPADSQDEPRRRDDAATLAQRFHEAYERLAPSFGYETREASAKPWADVPANNRALMTAVCAEIIDTDVARLEAELTVARAETLQFATELADERTLHQRALTVVEAAKAYAAAWLAFDRHQGDDLAEVAKPFFAARTALVAAVDRLASSGAPGTEVDGA